MADTNARGGEQQNDQANAGRQVAEAVGQGAQAAQQGAQAGGESERRAADAGSQVEVVSATDAGGGFQVEVVTADAGAEATQPGDQGDHDHQQGNQG